MTTLDTLVKRLHEGGCTLVVAQGDDVRLFTRRGVADLMDLTDNDPAFLHGALVADKVVGKGAAALLVKGGVTALHTDLISRPALDLLRRTGIDVTYDILTDHIVNRDGTDWCPVERLCCPLDNIDEMVDAIRAFIHRKQTTL